MTAISWKSGISGNWTNGGDWSPASIPGINDTATIAATGTYVVTANVAIAAHSIILNSAGATLSESSTLTLGSLLTLTAGTFLLGSGGTVLGGTIAVGGGTFQIGNGTLNAVAVQGAVNLTGSAASLGVVNGLSLTQAGGGGAGSITVSGSAASLNFLDSETFDHATVTIGFATAANTARLTEKDLAGTGVTLTLGPSLKVLSNGGYSLLQSTDTAGNDGLVNAGTIGFGSSGGVTEITTNSFANTGHMTVTSGGTLDLLTGFYGAAGGEVGSNSGSIAISSGLLAFGRSFVNTGSVVATGGTVTLSGTFTNTGVFQATNTTLAIGGTISGGALLALLNNASDTVTYSALYDNTGAVLNIGSGSAIGTLTLTSTLPIQNGTIADAGGGFVFNGGTLTNVAYQGSIDLSRNGASLNIATNLVATQTGGGGGAVKLTGTSSVLSFLNSQSFNNAIVTIGSTVQGAVAKLQERDTTGTGATLTFGSTLQIVSAGGYGLLQSTDAAGNDTLINQGTVQAGVAGGLIQITANQFTNQGKLLVGSGATLDLLTGYYTVPAGALGSNSGTITNSGGTLAFGGSFTNTGSITVTGGSLAVSGSFADAGTLLASNAAVSLGGVFSGQNFLQMLNNASNVVTISGTYDNTGATLNVGSGTALGSIDLVATLPIRGGTIVDSGGGLILDGGTLDGVSYVGTLTAFGGDNATILDGLVVQNGTDDGPGLVNLTGGWSSLEFANTQTLGDLLVTLGDASGNTDSLYDTASGGTLTLGADVTVQQSVGLAQIYTYGGATTVNRGSIAVSGGTLDLLGSGGSFANAGTISVSGGASFGAYAFLGSSQFSNSGLLSVTGGAVATLEVGWSNTGTIAVSGATLQLGSDGTTAWPGVGTITASNATLELEGVFTTAQLSQVRLSGGTTEIIGVLQNAGSVLTVGSGSSLGVLTLAGGTITGGSIVDAAGGGVVFGDGTLDGVTYHGAINVGSGGDLWVLDGLTALASSGSGPGTITLTGGGSGLFVLDSETLNNATISLGDNSFSTDFIESFITPSAGTLTLGSNLTLNQATGDAAVYTAAGGTTVNNAHVVVSGGTFHVDYGSFVNAGTIGLAGATAQFNDNLTAFTNTGLLSASGGAAIALLAGWNNSGTISASGGATLQLGSDTTTAWGTIGTISATASTLDLFGAFSTAQLLSLNLSGDAGLVDGVLTNTGATLAIGAGTTLATFGPAAGGIIRGGVIADAGGGFVAAGGTLDGVTYRGALAVGTGSSMNVLNGLILNSATGGAGSLTLTGGGSTLSVLDSETLNRATLLIGNPTGATDILANAGGNGNTLTLGSTLVLRQTSGSAQLLSNGSADLTVNAGQLLVSGGSFDVSGGSFSNAGTISISGGGEVAFEAGTLANLAGNTLTGGVYVVGAGSTLELPLNGVFSTLAADLTLSGAGSLLQSLNGSGAQIAREGSLRTITVAGALRLLAGRSLSIPGALLDQGLLQLGGGTLSSTGTVTVSGTLSGFGSVVGGLSDGGVVEATGGVLTLVNIATGAGKLQIDGSGTLEIVTTNALASGFNGAGGTLKLDKPTSYSGTISGFGIGDTILLGGVTASTASITGNTLTVTLSNGSKLAYAVSGSFAGLTVQTANGAGGAAVTLASTAPIQITGLLNNQGATLFAGNGTTYDLAGGTVQGGTIADAGGNFVIGYGTLDGVTYNGAMTVGPNGALSVVDGLTLQSVSGALPGSVALTSGGSTLTVLDSETLDDAVMSIGDASGVADILVNGNTAGTLTLGSDFVLQQATGSAQLLSNGTADLTLNNGAIAISGGTLNVSGGSFSNAGFIAVSGGGAMTFNPGTMANFNGGTLSGGGYVIGAGSTLELPTASYVTTLAADLTLSGAGSQLQCLNGSGVQTPLDNTLRTITTAGALRLLAGRSLALGLSLQDQGLLQLGGGTLTDSASTTVTGTLSGYGTIVGRLTDNGVVEATGGQLTIVNIATGSGGLQIDATGTLELTTTDALASTFNGVGGTLQLDKPTSYTGAIGGFAVGNTMVLGGVTATGASIAGNTLTVNLTTGKALTYSVGGSFTGLSVQTTQVGTSTDVTLSSGTPQAPAKAAAIVAATAISASPVTPAAAGFLDSSGHLTGPLVAATAPGQTLAAIGATRTVFQGTVAAFGHDTIGPFTGSGSYADLIDFTDLSFGSAKVQVAPGAGHATVSFADATHGGLLTLIGAATAAHLVLMSDGHAGTLLVHR